MSHGKPPFFNKREVAREGYQKFIQIFNGPVYHARDVTGNVGDGGRYYENNGGHRGGSARPVNNNGRRRGRVRNIYASYKNLHRWFFGQRGENGLERQLHVITVGIFMNNSPGFIEFVKSLIRRELRKAKSGRRAVIKLVKITEREKQESEKLSAIGSGKRRVYTQTATTLRMRTFKNINLKTRVVVFRSRRAQGMVLRFLREEPDPQFVRLRLAILRVLMTITEMDTDELARYGAVHPDLTWTQAAIGIGEMAKADFNRIWSQILLPWSKRNSLKHHALFAWALYSFATDEDNKTIVFDLLEGCVIKQERGKPHIQAYAAVFACSILGTIDIKRSLNIIEYFMINSTFVEHMLAYETLRVLFTLATHTPEVLDTFKEWVHKMKRVRDWHWHRRNILLFFVTMIHGTFKNDSRPSDERNKSRSRSTRTRKRKRKRRSTAIRPQSESVNLWAMIDAARERNERQKALDSLIYLIKQCMEDEEVLRSAYITLQAWIYQADHPRTQRNHRQLIIYVLEVLQDETRYIDELLRNNNTFQNSDTANHLSRRRRRRR